MLWRKSELRSRAISTSPRLGAATIPSFPQWLGSATTPELVAPIANTKEELYRDLVRKHGMPPLPGVAYWVRWLHEQGWLQAIASSAPRPNIDVVLDALRAAHRFQAIVSAEDVHR